MKFFPICMSLLAVFIAFKLVGIIGWSWWLVTAPAWGYFAVLGGCYYYFMSFMNKNKKK